MNQPDFKNQLTCVLCRKPINSITLNHECGIRPDYTEYKIIINNKQINQRLNASNVGH